MFLLTAILFFVSISFAQENNFIENVTSSSTESTDAPIGCVCGIFLSGNFTKGSKDPPSETATIEHELFDSVPCSARGNRLCINKCVDMIMKHAKKSASIICGAIKRDCHRERAYLFIKNCEDKWINTNLSNGRDYCCKNGETYKCPKVI